MYTYKASNQILSQFREEREREKEKKILMIYVKRGIEEEKNAISEKKARARKLTKPSFSSVIS